MMRTTLDLPEHLIDEALKGTHIKTTTRVIISAWEDLIIKTRISGLKQFKGKINLGVDLNARRGRQCRASTDRLKNQVIDMERKPLLNPVNNVPLISMSYEGLTLPEAVETSARRIRKKRGKN
jgi:hypothetical protein